MDSEPTKAVKYHWEDEVVRSGGGEELVWRKLREVCEKAFEFEVIIASWDMAAVRGEILFYRSKREIFLCWSFKPVTSMHNFCL